jgi:hypothetical protein
MQKTFYKCSFLSYEALRRTLGCSLTGMKRHFWVTSLLVWTRNRRCKTAMRSDLITRICTIVKEKEQENPRLQRNDEKVEPRGLLYTGEGGLLSRRWFWLTFSPVIIERVHTFSGSTPGWGIRLPRVAKVLLMSLTVRDIV